MDLGKKRVLFISSAFFGYEKRISEKLKEIGADVDYFNERPDNHFVTKSLIRINRKFLSRKTNNYYNYIIGNTKNNKYDYIIIIRGETISLNRLKQLREAQKEAKFILYLWDSMHYNPNARVIMSAFDRVFSFDRADVDKYEDIEFLPLFYSDEFERAAASLGEAAYDVCFIGTVHTDRYKVLEKIITSLESQGRRTFVFCYYPSKWLYRIRSIFDPGFRKFSKKYMSFSAMRLSDVVDRIVESDAVIDINRPDQLGLTMRTIEAIGAKRKLITTNHDIVNYDIYSDEFVCVVDRDNPKVPDEFFIQKGTPFDDKSRESYSIDSWIRKVLS